MACSSSLGSLRQSADARLLPLAWESFEVAFLRGTGGLPRGGCRPTSVTDCGTRTVAGGGPDSTLPDRVVASLRDATLSCADAASACFPSSRLSVSGLKRGSGGPLWSEEVC